MSQPARQTTSILRVAIGIATAYALPITAVAVAQNIAAALDPEPDSSTLGDLLQFIVLAAWAGSLITFPAFLAWWLLHKARRATPSTAALTGLITGLLVSLTAGPLMAWSLAEGGVAFFLNSLFVPLGAVTGLAVWLTAYGWRQSP